ASKLVESSNITQGLTNTIEYNLSDAVLDDISVGNDRFEVLTEDIINEMVEYGAVKNTKKNWVRVLKEYRSSVNLNYDISTILDTILR
ncbi:35232_t:CDS:1, partial [Racocetra persica]